MLNCLLSMSPPTHNNNTPIPTGFASRWLYAQRCRHLTKLPYRGFKLVPVVDDRIEVARRFPRARARPSLGMNERSHTTRRIVCQNVRLSIQPDIRQHLHHGRCPVEGHITCTLGLATWEYWRMPTKSITRFEDPTTNPFSTEELPPVHAKRNYGTVRIRVW